MTSININAELKSLEHEAATYGIILSRDIESLPKLETLALVMNEPLSIALYLGQIVIETYGGDWKLIDEESPVVEDPKHGIYSPIEVVRSLHSDSEPGLFIKSLERFL